MEAAEALMKSALAGKAAQRHTLATLPDAEKLRILLRTQHMSDAIRATREEPPRAWPTDPVTLEHLSHPGPGAAPSAAVPRPR